MNSPIIQLLVLAGIAVFLILRLRSVLGTREGYEKPRVSDSSKKSEPQARRDFEVIEGGPDHDIIDHVPEDSEAAKALAEMKRAEPSFSVGEFLSGARGAYEMILMAFENGKMESVKPYLSEDVYEAFVSVEREREAKGITVEATFVGLSEIALRSAEYDPETGEAELTVRFTGEITSVVRNAEGEVIEGSPTEISKQRDAWTFARVMGVNDPNWTLVATGE